MTTPNCPDCQDPTPRHIGMLPNVETFAGKHLDELIPGGSLYICGRCSLVFRYPRLDDESYHRLYDNSLSEVWALDETRQDQALVLDYLRSALAPGSKVLDVGCYSGALLGELSDQFQKFGIEINQAAAARARENQRATVWRTTADIPFGLEFDAILAIDVIEHMASPKRFVESLLPFLSKNGSLIITTGDAQATLWRWLGSKWWYCSYAEHTAFISKSWLNYYASQSIFDLKKTTTFRYKKRKFNLILRGSLLAYALAPDLHKTIVNAFNKLRGRPPSEDIPGSGITEDHLFVVLSKTKSSSSVEEATGLSTIA